MVISENFIIGIGITVCGVVDFANGIILDSDGIWEEKNVPIVKMFRKQFSFPVIAANNVRSYANAYAFLQHDSQLQNMLFIRNEATMGVSLILNGQFYGATGILLPELLILQSFPMDVSVIAENVAALTQLHHRME